MEIILPQMAMASTRGLHFKAVGAERGTSPCPTAPAQPGQAGHWDRGGQGWVSPHRTEDGGHKPQEEAPEEHQQCHQFWRGLRGVLRAELGGR